MKRLLLIGTVLALLQNNTVNAQWQRFNFSNIKLFNTNSNYMYSVHTNSTYFLRTTNDWQTWDTIQVGYPIKYFSCDEYGKVLQILYINNKFKTYLSKYPSGPFLFIYQNSSSYKCYIHNNYVYLYNILDTIYSSKDTGYSFIAKNPFSPSSGYQFESKICDSVAFVYLFYTYSTGCEEIWRTSYNTGNTWENRTDNLFGELINVPPYLFLGKSIIYRSADGGHTFSSCSPALDVRSFAYRNGVLLAGTNNLGIYATINKGDTWVAFNDGLDTLCCNAQVAVTDSFYYVTLNDTITYRRPTHDLMAIANLATEPTISLFPNPAIDKVTISLPENTSSFSYQLYDLQGRLQLTGKTSNTQTELNVATLPRGLYVLKIITNQQIVAKKIVLQ